MERINASWDHAIPYAVPPAVAARAKETGQKIVLLVIGAIDDLSGDISAVCFPEVPRASETIAMEWNTEDAYAMVNEVCWRVMDLDGVRTALPMVFAEVIPEVIEPGVRRVTMPEGLRNSR